MCAKFSVRGHQSPPKNSVAGTTIGGASVAPFVARTFRCARHTSKHKETPRDAVDEAAGRRGRGGKGGQTLKGKHQQKILPLRPSEAPPLDFVPEEGTRRGERERHQSNREEPEPFADAGYAKLEVAAKPTYSG